MAHQMKSENRIMSIFLKSIRKTAVRNAGIPSLKGTFENKVPNELRKS